MKLKLQPNVLIRNLLFPSEPGIVDFLYNSVQFNQLYIMKYIYDLPCSECERIIPHTISYYFDYGQATCAHCKAESYYAFGDGEQEVFQEVFLG